MPVSRLPKEYQEVEWIQSNECLIDLQYVPHISPVAVMTFSIENGGDRDIMGFSSNTRPSFIVDYVLNATNNRWFNRYFTTSGLDFEPHPELSQKYTWEFGRIVKCNGVTVFTMRNSTNDDWSTNDKSFYLFGARNRHARLKAYDFKLYDGGDLVRNLVPCYRKLDDVIGMYDLITRSFFTTSAGSFTKGNDV